MVETTVVRTIRVKGTSEGIDKLTGDLTKLAGAQENVAVVSEQTARRTLSVEAAWKRQSMQLDENFRAQEQIARSTKVADNALSQGLITQQQHAERLQLITQRYSNVIDATDKFGKQTGLARHELINLGRQAQDVGVSLLSGQSPFTVLAQQGSQIADVFISSGKSVGSFFTQAGSWALNFLKSTGGIVTAIAAIGGAAVYAAYQFGSASKTVEQALEEQNRLLKEGKALIDARTSAEARAQLQAKSQTQFETMQNRIDLEIKLRNAMEETFRLAQKRSGMPSQVPGEMGEAPTGFAPSQQPGFREIAAAQEELQAKWKAGIPGLEEFNEKLGRIGVTFTGVNAEVVKAVQEMLAFGKSATELEKAAVGAKALEDAIKGVATSSQLAVLGFKSLAQFQVSQMNADTLRENTERSAQSALALARNYGTANIEVAKTLASLDRQLSVAQAVGQMAQIEAQHEARISELSQSIGHTQAARVAGRERLVSLARIEAQHQETMVALRGQLDVASQVTGIGQINAQYQATVDLLTLQIGQARAIEQAELQRQTAIAGVNAEAARMLISLQQEGELIRASTDAERDRIKARQTYQNLVDKGVTAERARAVASQQLSNATYRREEQQRQAEERGIANIKTTTDAWKLYEQGVVSWSVANDEAGKVARRTEQAMEDQAFAANMLTRSLNNLERAANFFTSLPFTFDIPLKFGGGPLYEEGKTAWRNFTTQFNPAGYTSGTAGIGGQAGQLGMLSGAAEVTQAAMARWAGMSVAQRLEAGLTGGGTGQIDKLIGNFSQGRERMTASAQLLARIVDVLPKGEQAGVVERQIAALQKTPETLARNELMKQLNDQLEQLRKATEDNTDALKATADPLFSQGHEYLNTLRIGYYKAARGLTGVVEGTGGTDSTPVHMMLTPGETVTVIPPDMRPGRVSNDNSRTVNVTQNITVNEARPVDRLTGRQRAQGFIKAATMAAG